MKPVRWLISLFFTAALIIAGTSTFLLASSLPANADGAYGASAAQAAAGAAQQDQFQKNIPANNGGVTIANVCSWLDGSANSSATYQQKEIKTTETTAAPTPEQNQSQGIRGSQNLKDGGRGTTETTAPMSDDQKKKVAIRGGGNYAGGGDSGVGTTETTTPPLPGTPGVMGRPTQSVPETMEERCLENLGGNAGLDESGDANSDPNTQKIQTADQPGRFPTSHYDIEFNAGTGLNFFQTILGTITNFVFSWTTFVVHLGLWFLDWAFSFSLVGILSRWATGLNHVYNKAFILGSINLQFIFLTIVTFYGGYHIVRGRFSKGMSEMLVSGVIFVLLWTITASGQWPGGYMQDGFKLVGGLAGEIMNLAHGEGDVATQGGTGSNHDPFYGVYGLNYASDSDWNAYLANKCSSVHFGNTSKNLDDSFANYQAHYKQIICPTVADIHRAFVEEPTEYANWGRLLSGNYAKVRDNLLISGPWGTEDKARTAFSKPSDSGNLGSYYGKSKNWLIPAGDPTAKQIDNYNNHPTTGRLMIVFMTFISALVSMISIIVLSLSVGVSQFVAAVLFALAPVALACGLLPGGGRTVMIRWLTSLLKVFVIVLVLSNFLVLLTAGIDEIMIITQHDSLLTRFAFLMLVVGIMFVARKKMHEGTGRALSSMGNQLMNLRVGNGGGGRGGGGGQPWPVRPMDENHHGGINQIQKSKTGAYAQRRVGEYGQSRRGTKRHYKEAMKRDQYGYKRGRISGKSKVEKAASNNLDRVANGKKATINNPLRPNTWMSAKRKAATKLEMQSQQFYRQPTMGKYEINSRGKRVWKSFPPGTETDDQIRQQQPPIVQPGQSFR